MKRNNFRNHLIYPLIVLAAAVVFMLPVWFNGIPYSMDSPQHYQFAASIENSLRSGDFFPNWASRENNGYGGVGLRFYPPLAYYVLAVGKILTNDWYLASYLAFLFWTALSGFGIYCWAREWFAEKSSAVAAVLYIFAPYHAIQLYTAFLYAEFAAAAILPFCFLFITRICRRGSLIDILGFAIFYAALIFTHLPLTVIGSIAFGIYAVALVMSERRKIKREYENQTNTLRYRRIFTFAKLFSGIVLGLLASSFQWIKVITEIRWINHATEVYSKIGLYDYRQNFLLSFPYLAGLNADARNLWFIDLSLLITLISTVPLAILFFKKAESGIKRQLFAVGIVSVVAMFMASILSRPVWDSFGFLQKVQFPWRWFSIVSICLVIFCAAGFEYLLLFAKNKKQRPIFFLIAGGIFIGLSFSYAQVIRQAVNIEREEFSAGSEKFATVSNFECWLPVWAKKEAQDVREKAVVNNRKVTISNWNDKTVNLEVERGEETQIRFALFYYPHWKATINGENAEVFPSPDGALALNLPLSKASVKIEFAEPFVVRLSVFITVTIWIILILSLVYVLARKLYFDKVRLFNLKESYVNHH